MCELQKKEMGGSFWICPSCRAFSVKITAKYKELDTKVTKIEKQVTELQKTTESLVTEKATMNDKLEKVEKATSELKEGAKSDNEAAARLVLTELREQESRKDNIIIQNVAESTKKDFEERKSDDREKIVELATVLEVDLSEVKIKFIKRLGKKDDNTVRPLLVGFRCNVDRENLLEKAKNLRKMRDTEWYEVYISPDLTHQQRKEDERLKQESEKKNAERSEEEAKNFEFCLVGKKGQKKLVKTFKATITEGSQTEKGGIQTRRGGRGKN